MEKQKTYTVQVSGTVTWTVEDFLNDEGDNIEEANKLFDDFRPTDDDVFDAAGILYRKLYDWDTKKVIRPYGPDGNLI